VTMRDDSILVQPPPNSWYHAEMAQEFWPRLPVILEHEHYGGSEQRGAWNGDLLLKSVEDYHASYMSIHWLAREELNENRETVARINRRIGYRIQLKEISWPREVKLGEAFTVEATWANAGVAPLYAGGFWSWTVKDDQGGIVSAQVDESLDLRNLKVGPPDQAPAEKIQSRLTLALRLVARAARTLRRRKPALTTCLSPWASATARQSSRCRSPATTVNGDTSSDRFTWASVFLNACGHKFPALQLQLGIRPVTLNRTSTQRGDRNESGS